jgi:two-component system phosphate regulon sensor histidine kinase PhoR
VPPIGNGVWGELYYHIYRMRQRNRKSKRRLANVINRFRESTSALPDAAVVLQATGEIEWFNGAAAQYLGLSAPNDIGQRLINLVRHPSFAEYMTNGEFNGSLEISSPVDDTIVLDINIVPYGGKNQNLLVARDITHIKKLENMRKDFVANVSHELRTPLTVLTGTLESLADADDSETLEVWRRSLGHMQQHNMRMLSIVDDLLMISRLETEDNQRDHYPVSLSAMLSTIYDEANVLSAKQHDIKMDVAPSLWLMGDEKELHSAFSNLVANAIRYSPTGGLITVSCHQKDKGLYFCVKDSGIGIAPHHIQRLTERFYRVDAGRSRASGGTGLGLAIVKHVLDRHGARLEITSRIEKGSEFCCYFPADRICTPEK